MTEGSSSARSTRGTRVRIRPRQVVALLIILLLAVFIGQNRETVDIELFTIDIMAPLWLTLSVVTVLGLVIGLLVRRRR